MMISVYHGYCENRPRFFPEVLDNSAAVLQSYVNEKVKSFIIFHVNVYLWTCQSGLSS